MNKLPAAHFLFFVCIVLLSVFPAKITKAAPIRLVALDVGEGQSILVLDQEHGVLIDTGHAGKAPHILARMKDYGLKKLDYLILTHLHPDHASGYFRIREAFPQTPVLSNCHPIIPSEFIDQDMMRWVHDALITDKSRRCVKRGDKIFWQGHQLEFLWPLNPAGTDLNHHSLVVQIVSRKGKKLLIMGDVDRTVEEDLFKTRQEEWKNQGVDVFIAGHHGAEDTGNEDFIKLIHPYFTIVSVNRNNLKKYPSDKTLQVLGAQSRFVFRTDRDGEICVTLAEQPVVCEDHFSADSF